jgi:1-phosphofructokinase family hexose kinase
VSAREPVTPARWPGAAVEVHVVGPNPAMDRLQTVEHLRPGQVHRVRTVTARAGGKSFIVARSIRQLGVGVNIYGFLGGPVAELAAAECERLGIRDLHTPIAGSTRITPVIVETETGRSTVLNEPGPDVTHAEQQRFRDGLRAHLSPGAIVVCTGSLPPTVDPRLYADIVRAGQEAASFVAVDASGDVLRAALASAPWLVKCNRDEFLDATGCDIHPADTSAVAAQMQTQLLRGTTVVIVTMGASDLLAATADGVWRASVPPVDVVNATGSGDTFLACFLATAAKGGGFADALRAATAGGAANAAQLEPGLQHGTDLDEYLDAVVIRPMDDRSGAGSVSQAAAD